MNKMQRVIILGIFFVAVSSSFAEEKITGIRAFDTIGEKTQPGLSIWNFSKRESKKDDFRQSFWLRS